MNQTAVEWFEIELKNNLGKIVINQNWQLLEELINEAKEMEKEQIRKAYFVDVYSAKYGFEQYYNDNFKTK